MSHGQARMLGDLPFGPGSSDEYVLEVQRQLVAIGFYLVTTGSYDEQTAEAVRSFQLGAGLPPTGIVDLSTLDAISAAANAVAPVKPFRPGSRLQDELSITGRVPIGGLLAAAGLGWLVLALLKKKPREATT